MRLRSLPAPWLRTALLACGLSLLAAGPIQAQTMTENFDGLTCSSANTASPVPANTGGLTWTNFLCLNSSGYGTPTNNGYRPATRSQPNVILGAPSVVNQVTRSGGGVFTLNSAYLTAAWNDGLQVRVEAFRSGARVQVLTFTPSASAATLVNFTGMVNVDRVVFSASGGRQHPGYQGGGGGWEHFALDDVNYTLGTVHAITVAPAPVNGTMSCAPTLVPNGTNATCTATPAPGYFVASFTGCTRVGTTNDCQLTNVTAPATVSATFAPITYPITITLPSNGTLACTPNPVNHGSSATCTATPATGYTLASFSGPCTRVGSTNDCQLTNVTAPATVSATFAQITYPITITPPSNGTLACAPNPAAHGGNVTCTATPAAGYAVTSFSGGCTRVGTGNTCTLTNVTAPATVSATFALATYAITAANDPNGTLTCTPNPVTHGGNVTCTATPAAGYLLSGFTGCTQVGTGNTCTLSNVTGPATVAALFTAPVPTLSQWALMLLGLGAAGMGARRLRRAA